MSEALPSATTPGWSASGALPKTGGTMTGALNMGSNSISGATTLAVTNTTNQITLGTTNTVTVNSTAPSTSRTYTINPIAGNGEFALISTTGGSKLPVSYETPTSITGTNISPTAAQLATGLLVLTYSGSSPYYLTLPTGAAIAANSSLAPFNTAGAVFKVHVSIISENNVATLTGSSGCNVAGGVNMVFGFARTLYFVAAGSSVWNVY